MDSHEVGGAEVALRHLLEALSPGFEATVVGVSQEVVAAVAGERADAVSISEDHASSAQRVRAWRRALATIDPDVVHLNMTSPWSCTAALTALTTLRRPKVVAVHHLPMPNPSLPSRALLRALFARVDVHVAVGRYAARLVERYTGLPAQSVVPIHLGVPAPPDGPTGRRTSGTTIGTIARLTEQKGIDLLVRAVAQLPYATATVVGDGPERSALERLARDLGVADRVTFAGWAADPRPHLSTFDVFCLPSRFEGLPLAIMEAMLAGVPVVTTDVGSIREAIIPGQTGVLVAAGNLPALVAALDGALRDRVRSDELADAARVHARRSFTTAAMAGSFEALYSPDEAVRC